MSNFLINFDQLYDQSSIFIHNLPQIEGLCKQQNSILLSPFNFCQSGISAVLFPKLLKISFQSKKSVNYVHQLYLILDRSVKVSLIYQKKVNLFLDDYNNVNSRIIGFAIYKDINCQYQFLNSNQQVVSDWIIELSKYIYLSGFNSDFKSVKYIGRGQFGQAWQVKRLRDNNMFAAKIIDKRECFGQVNGQQCLYNQIQILRKIDHPNISKLQAIYESERKIFIILQFVQGQNLAQFIKNRNKIINQKHAKNIYKQQNRKIMKGLLKAVEYLHTNGIVHRDLKPGNIIIHRTNWTPYIIDFGLSQFIQKQNKLFQCCGSPGYIAPELFTNQKNYNIEKSDMFSLGAIFYLLLTANPLINADSTQQIINETKNSNKIKRKINSQIQGPQKQFLYQLLNNDVKKRISAEQALNHDYFIQSMFNQLQDMRKTHQKALSSNKYSIHAKNVTTKFQELFSQSMIVLQNKFQPHFYKINNKQNINGLNINLVLPSEQYNQRRKIRSKRYLSSQNIETNFPNNKIQSLNSWSGKRKNFKTLQLLFKNNNFWHFRDPSIII